MNPLTSLRVRGLIAGLVAIVAFAMLPSAASAFVYWANQRGEIGRANPDGTGVNRDFIKGVGSPQGLAVDARHIYWANDEKGSIGRANLDGTKANPEFIKGARIPQGVAVDGQHIYWANRGTNTIGRANLNGTKVQQSFIAGAHFPQGVAVNRNFVYWSNRNLSAIGRARLNGSGADQNFVLIPGSADLDLIAIDSSHVYWSNQTGDLIGRANLNGSGVEPSFISGVSKPLGLAVGEGALYWANNGTSTIGRAVLGGGSYTEVNRNFITDAKAPIGVAIDAGADTKPPKTKITKRAPKVTKKHKVKFKFKSSEPNSTFQCKLDKGKFERCKSPTTLKGLKKGKHTFQVRAVDASHNIDPTPARAKFKVKR